jgi:hypothetical protein
MATIQDLMDEIEDVKKQLSKVQGSVEYTNKLLEDMTMQKGNNQMKNVMSGQAVLLKQLFDKLPIDPELKKSIDAMLDTLKG